ncbi:hypothetical protein HJ526_00240 [Donghicola sp. C2-DW-16]|uniref:Uncharacterized protein n=1 Tax=Donghicola mangrovi TaxID=2729614 RepID=A0A850Q0Q1_9RHOB|nr:DUF5665 domain-containing protein [Donghicola mangrovi]NVO22574.1 hypothetical protein [Donghicola mangrovi]NVO25832.1 hypothetical protein [Donghicola mangrovi]
MSDSDIQKLTAEIAKLNNHKFLRAHDSYHKMMLFQLLRGISFGLGSVLGATILVSFVGFWLSKIEFVPLIGDYAAQIAREIMHELPDTER